MIVHGAGETSKLAGHLLMIGLGQPKRAVFALKLERLTVLQKSMRSDENRSLRFLNGWTVASASRIQPLVGDRGTQGMAEPQPCSSGELRGAAAHVVPVEQAWQKEGSE